MIPEEEFNAMLSDVLQMDSVKKICKQNLRMMAVLANFIKS